MQKINYSSAAKNYSLTANELKIIAIMAMFFDHFCAVFLDHSTIIGLMSRTPGRIAAPIFCYFIAEGYHYTSNREKYISRLLIFAAISHLPYNLFLIQWLRKTSIANTQISSPSKFICLKASNLNSLKNISLLRLLGVGLMELFVQPSINPFRRNNKNRSWWQSKKLSKKIAQEFSTREFSERWKSCETLIAWISSSSKTSFFQNLVQPSPICNYLFYEDTWFSSSVIQIFTPLFEISFSPHTTWNTLLSKLLKALHSFIHMVSFIEI